MKSKSKLENDSDRDYDMSCAISKSELDAKSFFMNTTIRGGRFFPYGAL